MQYTNISCVVCIRFSEDSCAFGSFSMRDRGDLFVRANISIECITGEIMTSSFEYVIIFIEPKV